MSGYFLDNPCACGETPHGNPRWTLQQLRVLLAVVEHRTFTRAAQALLLTQSGVSQHVRALERTVGLPLVERLGRRVEPTDAGRTLAGYARELLRLEAEAQRRLADLRTGATGRIRLAASATDGLYLLPALVSGYRATAPDVEVIPQVEAPRTVLDLVAAGRADVGLVGGPILDPRVAAQAVCPDRLVLIAGPASPLIVPAALAPLPLAHIAAQPLLVGADAEPAHELVASYFARQGINWPGPRVFASTEAVKKGAEAGVGIAFVSAWTIEREVALGTLRVLPYEGAGIVRHYELIYRPDRYVSTALATFMQFAHERLNRLVPSLVQQPIAPREDTPPPPTNAAGRPDDTAATLHAARPRREMAMVAPR